MNDETLSSRMLKEQELSNDLRIIELCLRYKRQPDFLKPLAEMDAERKKWIENTIAYLRTPLSPFPCDE